MTTITTPAPARIAGTSGTVSRPCLDDLVSAVLLQAEAVEVLAREVWEVPGSQVGSRLQVAAKHLVDTAYELAAVRDRMARFQRLAA